MLKEDCERIGVLECGAAFQKIGFMFREQPIGDYGIDAIIETRDRCTSRQHNNAGEKSAAYMANYKNRI